MNRVPRRTIQHLFFVLHQAERSVDFALRNPDGLWSEFRSYFSGVRQEQVDIACDFLHRPLEERSCIRTLWDFIKIRISALPDWRYVRDTDITRVADVACEFQRLLSVSTPPERFTLLDMRRKLYAGERILARYCGRVRIWELAKRVEHFGQSEYQEFESIPNLLADEK